MMDASCLTRHAQSDYVSHHRDRFAVCFELDQHHEDTQKHNTLKRRRVACSNATLRSESSRTGPGLSIQGASGFESNRKE